MIHNLTVNFCKAIKATERVSQILHCYAGRGAIMAEYFEAPT